MISSILGVCSSSPIFTSSWDGAERNDSVREEDPVDSGLKSGLRPPYRLFRVCLGFSAGVSSRDMVLDLRNVL